MLSEKTKGSGSPKQDIPIQKVANDEDLITVGRVVQQIVGRVVAGEKRRGEEQLPTDRQKLLQWFS